MIKDKDILYAFTEALKGKFNYKNFISENKQEVKQPSFFVSLRPLTNDSYLRWNEKSINVSIVYTNEVTNLEELLDVKSELDELFDMYIKVGITCLMFKKKTFKKSENDDFLTLNITINYLDGKTSIPPSEQSTKKMENLNYRDGDK